MTLRPFLRPIALTTALTLGLCHAHAQDYRSANSGNWNQLGTWEQSTDGGTTWGPAASTPTNASGAITVRSPHTVTVTVTVNLDDVTIEAGGTVSTTTGGTGWVIDNGTFGVEVFGTFNAGFGGGSFGCCGTVSVENGGVVNMNAGGAFFGPTTVQAGGTVIGNTPINLGGGTIVNNGTWTMTGGNALTNSAGGTFTNNGTLTLQGFTVGGTFTNNNAASWNSGTISGAGNIVNANGAALIIGTTNGKALGSTFTNNGTINWTGGGIGNSGSGNFQNTNGAVFKIGFTSVNQLAVPFTNQAGGTVNQNAPGTFATINNGNGLFTNAGTINLVNGNWSFDYTFNNSGTIDIPAGRTLTFNNTTNLNTGTIFTGSGSIIGNANVTQNFPWTNATHSFTLSNGTWTNSAANPTVFAVGSTFNWTGGTLTGAGNYSTHPGFTTTISTNNKNLGSTFTNNGTINWTGGGIGNSGSGNFQNTNGAVFNIGFISVNQLSVPFTNQAGATVNQNASGTFATINNGNGLFTNAGTINLVNGNWSFDYTFNNSGTIDIPAGRTLTFNNTTNLNTGTIFTGSGSIIGNANVTQNFPWTNATHSFTLSNGTWTNSAANPTVFAVGSTFNWTGGTLTGAGNYSTHPGFTTTISTNNKNLGSTFTNNGTINWTGGGIGNSGSGNFQNTNGAVFNIGFISVNQLAVPFTNQAGGTVNQNASGTFATINNGNGLFTNAGTINLVNGNWNFDFTNSHSTSSTINVAASRTLTFNTAPSSFAGTVINAGTIAGTVPNFTGPSFTNNGSVTLTNLPFAATSAQQLNGTGSIAALTINNANGVSLGGTQTVTGTLTFTYGRITLDNNDLILSNTALGALAGTVNATNRIVTDGTGAFHRQIPIGGSSYPFPIGTASSYLPATLSNTSGPAERFGARVANDVYSDYSTPGSPAGTVVVNDQVERTWTITEQTEGGNQATVQLQWNSADEGANFNRGNSGLHSYNGTDWVALALGTAGGSNPYTRSTTSVGVFREFTVADGESTLPFVCNNALVPGAACNDNDACTINDAVNASCVCAGTFQDTDGDGACNAEDGCPNDANKTELGICGCGVADVPVTYFADVDGDGFGDPNGDQQPGYTCNVPPGYVANSTDQCPTDGTKQTPGACGCDVPDVAQNYYADTDGDGFGGGPAIPGYTCDPPANTVTNNTDACPNDPLKQAPGTCGCGNAETDNDGDGTPNCIDACPNDPLKITQGQCGCGNPDTDSDNDGAADCVDGCPNDPLKTAAGQCGCGNADTDTDNDGIADCVDTCPGVTGQIGSACDDGLATTGNDVLDNACECHGQLIDCLGVPGGAALPGTACTVSNLPGIWSASCVCELEGPDVAVQNVSAVNDTIAPDQVITLNWDVANLGNAAATVNWTERYYMESGSGQSRTLITQAPYTSGTPLAAGTSLPRSSVLTMPALINVDDDARFVVELVPGTGLTELPNSTANNTGTQATNWIVRKLLKLLVPQPNLTEGAVAGVPITVQRTGSLTNALTVNIGIDESERFTFPTSITILAGQSARSFTLVALDNALLEGTIPAVLIASSSGFLPATRNLTIIDNESPALSFTGLPATTGEGTTVSFQVATNFAPTQPLQVFLTSSAPTRFAVPASVTIAANTTSVPVNVSLPQDALPELDITVNLTAGAAGHTAANASLQLTDDDVPGLELILQTDTVSESGGAFAVQATLRRTAGSPPIAFTAALTPSLANTLILPATLSLAANASQQTFTIGVIDNAFVDGYRTVAINAAVQMAGCGCSAPPSTVANVNADLTVVDNDGPSLTVTVNPATLAEGLANAGTLRVQRNTSTATALTVDLSSYDPSEITLPATAMIPIGALYVDVPITTMNDGTPDGSQQVYVQAAASGFAPGIAWCIVTDVNQPDLVVTALSASASPWPALTPITWQATISNTGFANSIVGTPVRGVLSQNNIVDAGDIVLFDYTINTPVVAGSNVQISGAAVVPNNPGTHKLLIQVNPSASVSELTYTNNTSQPLNVSINPSYTATAQVAGTTFLRGTTIPVTGTAVRPDLSPAANEPIEVYVLTNGLRREVLTTTNAAGAFTASFVPLANESGHYTIGASFPGMGQTTEQDAFDIHGVRLNNGQYPQFVVLIGDTLSGTLAVQNMSDATLTNLTLVPTNVPAGATFSFGSLATLAGGATANISFDVSGTVLTPGFNYAAAMLNVVSDQGTIQPQQAYYYCQVPGGNINADISSITTSVSQSAGQQLVQFRVMNNGAGSTGALSLSLPSVPWLTAMTPVNMPALAPGDTALVILRFLADASVPFDTPINGTIAINGANSNSLVLPFTFTKVSTTVGDLTVDAVNQFTFFDEDEPHVAGAAVEVRHQYTNALLASGVTDANGLFTMTGLPEGTHRLVVSKPQHLPTEQLVTVNPGTSVTQTVFIQYQAITFSWSVVPTQVQDQYDVQLNMVFETNIPIPVVTIDMPDTMPQLFGDEVYAFNVTLTNHGLITAEEVTLNLPQDDPEYEFITNYIPSTLSAQQSVQVPVLMRLREEPLEGSLQLDVEALSEFLRIDGPAPSGPLCKEEVVIFWKYNCNLTTGIWERNGELFSFLNRVCEPEGPGVLDGVGFNPSVFGNGFPECPFCPDPSIFAGTGNTITGRTIYAKNCKECLYDFARVAEDALIGALGKAVGEAVAGRYSTPTSNPFHPYAETAQGNALGNMVESSIDGHSYKPIDEAAKKSCLEFYGPGASDRCSPPDSLPSGGPVAGAINAALGCSNLFVTASRTEESRARDVIGSALLEALQGLQLANDAYMTRDSIGREYFGALFSADDYGDLRTLMSQHIGQRIQVNAAQRFEILGILSSSSYTQVSLGEFLDRWNHSINALDVGVLSPNPDYPNIIDWARVDGYEAVLDSAISVANLEGFESVWDLYSNRFADVMELVTAESNSVCASVTVQLSQTVTMTREAFTGTLDIFNGHPTDGIDSLSVNILITDPDGVPSNGLFQINTEQLTGLSDVTGTGQIPSQEHGIVQFLFIPEPGAALTVPVPYGFGGSVTYWDPYNEEMTTIELAPITLTVNPSPDLMLHYFMERNILGDDALTSPDVEPSIPAELAVMIENHGYGAAQNMKISSAQPEIVENESGLAINFELIGSNLQGQPANLGVLDIPFGNIPPHQTKVGQWWFTSSLLGKFVSYEATVVHANSFGNPELSLIQGVELHELTRSIREYGPQGDGMNDFLVNDQFDIHDVPDIIYFSQGMRTAEVLPAASGSFNAPVNAPTFTNTLTVTASEPGWNYIKLDDPGNGDYDIVSVTRQDNQAIPLANAWLTFVTLPVSQQPVYEDKFHIVDTLASTSPTSYTVVWAPKNTDVPAVDTILGAPTAISAAQVTQLTVVFDKAIDPATFTVDDLTLTFQGGPDLMSNAATITQVDPFTFTVDLTALTTGDGLYVFTAQAAGVTDLYGISGVAGRQVSWTQFISVPAIIAFQGLPNGTTDNAFTTIELLFNRPIDETSLTAADLSVLLDGSPQAGALTITRMNSDSTLFLVSGLENVMSADGAYTLGVDMPNVLSTEGVPGLQAQSVVLTLDGTGPTVAELTPITTGGLDAQHRTGVNIRFSEPVADLTIGAITFTRGGNPLPLLPAQLSQVDADEWRVTGFGMSSYPDGAYAFTVSAAGLTDAIGNAGSGSLAANWTVDRSTPISVTNVGISPDLGISSTDGLTSTLGFNALFTLSEPAAQVTVAQTSFGTENVLATLQNVGAGAQSVPVNFPTGGNTGLKVTAIGTNGGNANGTKSLYIDQTPLSATWQTATNQSLTSTLDAATLSFSAELLDPGAIAAALTLKKDGQPVSTVGISITPASGTAYSISGLAAAASGTGLYELRIDAAQLHKASSGIAGAGTAALTWTVVPGYSATLRARVFLEGPYASGLMHDSLRTLPDFPLTEPFTALAYAHVGGGGEAVNPSVLAVQGNEAIVDWVVVELRDRDDNTAVVASRSALLQRDGDVVGMDGFSPITFPIGAGAYYIAIRHRNHLGAMTADTARFHSGITQADLTLLTTTLYGSEAQKQIGARRALWAGDVNFDGALMYVGQGNDRDPILVAIGGSTPTNTVSGYRQTDVNLDGRVKYIGQGNDRDPILVNIGGSTPTNVRESQIPQP